MKKVHKKRILSALLTFAMVISLFPQTVQAEGITKTTRSTVFDSFSKIESLNSHSIFNNAVSYKGEA